MATLLDSTARHLRRTALAKQRSGRLPGLYAGVCRGGELVWGEGIGVVEVGADRAPTADDQFLVASNTKTFTAVMVMQLRDEGRLALDDLLGDHVPEVSHPLTIRQCLAHVSGMAREPLGDVWETLEQPDAKTLRRDFDDVERVGRPHDHWHYSNVVYAMLGQLVEELDGRSWEESLRTRLLDPLGMRRTSVGFDDGPHATGYYVGPYDDVPRPEPVLDLKAMAPCGGLASTAHDLALWSAFVADPGSLLSADTMEEMCQPQVLLDPDQWTGAMGLGFFLVRSPTRTHLGRPHRRHAGPHHRRLHPSRVRHRRHRADELHRPPHPTRSRSSWPTMWSSTTRSRTRRGSPGRRSPTTTARCWDAGSRRGSPSCSGSSRASCGRGSTSPGAERLTASRFEKVADDVYRDLTGRERGELLRITRAPDGTVTKLNWATYLFTREPIAFGESFSG